MRSADITTCFEAHRARVYRWAYGLCRRHEDAADVVQETFSRLLESRPALPSEAATVAWLRRVAERIVVDRWRRAATGLRIVASAPLSSESDSADDETRRAVRDALQQLSQQQRLVIMAKFYDDLTFEQAAAELGISVPTAKTHYLRALAALRDRLALVRV